MDREELPLSPQHRAVLERFVAACTADAHIVAATLYGSYARGAADTHSDLDLGVITTDEAYGEFVAKREVFARLLGEPAFLEDFDSTTTVFLIYTDGAEVELTIGREGQLNQHHGGAYRVLLDKKGILTGVASSRIEPEPAEQIEMLRRQIYWFWHDLSHFTAAMSRGQLWWACGQIEELRRSCVNLARLRHNFADPDVGSDPYFKVEHALPVEELLPLEATFCPMERGAMIEAARIMVRYYREVTPGLARAYGIAYPADLERMMVDRLEELDDA